MFSQSSLIFFPNVGSHLKFINKMNLVNNFTTTFILWEKKSGIKTYHIKSRK